MTEFEEDPIIERIAREARRPIAVDPDARVRLIAAIRAESAVERSSGVFGIHRGMLTLSVGRHLYSLLVVDADGEHWSADPHAPAAPDDGFGRANSVVLVGKPSS